MLDQLGGLSLDLYVLVTCGAVALNLWSFVRYLRHERQRVRHWKAVEDAQMALWEKRLDEVHDYERQQRAYWELEPVPPQILGASDERREPADP